MVVSITPGSLDCHGTFTSASFLGASPLLSLDFPAHKLPIFRHFALITLDLD